MTIPAALAGFGVLLFLASLPTVIIAFAFACFSLYLAGLVIGGTGLFCIVVSILLKIVYLLFRA